MNMQLLVAAAIIVQAVAPINQLVQQLQQAPVATRVAALKALGARGAAASTAVPAIIDALNENRAGTATGVGMGKPISPAITDAALLALKSIGPGAHDAAPYITPLLKDRNELLRRTEILETLNAIGPSSDSALVLMRVVGEEGKLTYARSLAIQALGKIDPPAVEATEMLRELTEDQTDKQCRADAMKALSSITERATARAKAEAQPEDSTLHSLRFQIASSNSAEARIEALDKIAEAGPKAAPLVPILMQMTNEKDKSVRHAVLTALGAIGKEGMAAIPNLISRFFSQPDQYERAFICRTVTKIDPTGSRTLPLLQESLDDPFKARLAIEMLNELGTDETTTMAQKARQRWKIK